MELKPLLVNAIRRCLPEGDKDPPRQASPHSQVSFFWAGVNFYQLMIFRSAGTVPSGASAQTRLCSSLGPWQWFYLFGDRNSGDEAMG